LHVNTLDDGIRIHLASGYEALLVGFIDIAYKTVDEIDNRNPAYLSPFLGIGHENVIAYDRAQPQSRKLYRIKFNVLKSDLSGARG